MAAIQVGIEIDAPPEVVWSCIDDITTHVEWMADAVAIRFTTDQRSGVGTTFDCDTKVGPLRLTDRMAITEWRPAESMGVRHVGLVTGTGAFTLAPVGGGHTRFTWAEELHFPWWLGGRLGGLVGAPVLARIWRANLRRLKARVES